MVAPITEVEIKVGCKGINDIITPGVDGYGAKIFKVFWDITKINVINVVMEFFEKEKKFKAMKNTLVTPIPKTSNAKIVRSLDLYLVVLLSTRLYLRL